MTLLIDCCWYVVVLNTAIFLWRTAYGESPAEKAIAFDGVATCMTCLIAILSIKLKTIYFYDAIIIFTLLGFLGTFSIAKYLEKGNILHD